MAEFRPLPPYKAPTTVPTPQIDEITKQRTFIQSGIHYRTFRHINPLDPNELLTNSRSINFYYLDRISWLNPTKIFLSLTVSCEKHDGTPITYEDKVTCAPIKSTGLIDDISVTLGKYKMIIMKSKKIKTELRFQLFP